MFVRQVYKYTGRDKRRGAGGEVVVHEKLPWSRGTTHLVRSVS